MDKKRLFLNSFIKIEKPPIPDTILWENMYIPIYKKKLRRSLGIFLTLLLILFSIISVVYLKYMQTYFTSKYPQQVNCDDPQFMSTTLQ